MKKHSLTKYSILAKTFTKTTQKMSIFQNIIVSCLVKLVKTVNNFYQNLRMLRPFLRTKPIKVIFLKNTYSIIRQKTFLKIMGIVFYILNGF